MQCTHNWIMCIYVCTCMWYVCILAYWSYTKWEFLWNEYSFILCNSVIRLDDNYELSPAICLPRALIYDHYRQYCLQQCQNPAPQFKFGKVINVEILLSLQINMLRPEQIGQYWMWNVSCRCEWLIDNKWVTFQISQIVVLQPKWVKFFAWSTCIICD